MKQLDLVAREKENDRNFHLGGRSFYFFDFDDNVVFLTTPLVLFHKESGEELKITSGDFAQNHSVIGKSGIFGDYEIRWEDQTGTFRYFRDHNTHELERLGLKRQIFVHDVAHALGFPEDHWKGPSWSCFYHAAFNQRPLSVITARGHAPATIMEGIDLFVQAGHLPQRPNFLSIFPVNHIPTRVALGDESQTLNTAQLKQAAIRKSVQKAIEVYGYSPHHRFGMSDDDPKNIQLIVEEMGRLKTEYPEMSFFMIETQNGQFVKHEVSSSGLQSRKIEDEADPQKKQIKLFES